jgi:uncharacterized repeat protein (TIGR03803 family)
MARALAVGLSIAAGAQAANGAEQTLYEFRGGHDGADPYGSLITDGSGTLFGTTAAGGSKACNCGTVFRLTAAGTEKVLHVFTGGNDGAYPRSGLTPDSVGDLYGSTNIGGGSANCGFGCGTVFKIATDGAETVLYAFQGGGDGWAPAGNLIVDANNNLYGTTSGGGSYNGANCEVEGCGTVFELQPDGSKLTLYTFLSGSDGSEPWSGVISDGGGNLYGTTATGGSENCSGSGCGTVFKITPDGAESILYTFQGGSDGAEPIGLVMDEAGNLFGVTEQGGGCSSYDNDCGTIYKLAPDGTKTLLYDFKGGANDGLTPDSALVMDKAGNLYGATFFGSKGCKNDGGCGTVFEFSREGTEIVLEKQTHRLGATPAAGLLLGRHGELYGTAEQGGNHNDGTVFEIKK